MTKKISDILTESKAKQITGDLVTFENADFDKYDKAIPVGYCALGVLACYKRKYKSRADFRRRRFRTYSAILQAYDVPEELIVLNYSVELDFYIKNEYGNNVNVSSLDELIYQLNDTGKLTFKEIGQFLKTNLGL